LLQNHVRATASSGELLKESSDLQKEFTDYVKAHNRRYERGTQEFSKRYELFARRFQHVQAQNQRKDALWTAAVNTYSDRTDEELSHLRGWRGYTKSAGHVAHRMPSREKFSLTQAKKVVIPESKSWQDLNAVQASLDQGSCGSCWAVAAALTLEAHAEHACRNRSFSAQEIVSCVENPHHCGGSGGCNGATVELAMAYVIDHGLAKTEEVPYTATTSVCASSLLDKSKHTSIQHINDVTVDGVHTATIQDNAGAAFGFVSWEKLPENEYHPLLAAVAEHGPVAISVAASKWFSYNSGIFNSCSKDAEIDHAVTLIGYGKEGDAKYWLIKNSWGSSWGESGTMRLLRSDDDETNQCGTDRKPEVGTGCDGGPQEVKVCGMCGILYDTVVPHFETAC
jgi:cathepsin L